MVCYPKCDVYISGCQDLWGYKSISEALCTFAFALTLILPTIRYFSNCWAFQMWLDLKIHQARMSRCSISEALWKKNMINKVAVSSLQLLEHKRPENTNTATPLMNLYHCACLVAVLLEEKSKYELASVFWLFVFAGRQRQLMFACDCLCWRVNVAKCSCVLSVRLSFPKVVNANVYWLIQVKSMWHALPGACGYILR